jgi:hypothetical protein
MILGELAPIRTDSVGIEQIWIHRARFHQDERHIVVARLLGYERHRHAILR